LISFKPFKIINRRPKYTWFRLKILQINTGIFSIPPEKGGGTEHHLYEISKNLADIGVEIEVVTDISKGSDINPKIKIIKINSLKPSLNAGFLGWMLSHLFGGLLSFKVAFGRILSENYDVIHIHSRFNGFLICLFNSIFRKNWRIVYTLHNPGPWLGQYDSTFEEIIQKMAFLSFDLYVCRKVSKVIVLSKEIKKNLYKRWNIDKKSIELVYNGVDSQTYTKYNKPFKEIKEKYNISNKYILFVGQLHKRKGVADLLKSIKNIDYPCVIVGGGPERGNLEKLIKKLELNNVTLTGAIPRDDLISLYLEADLYVLPSTAEALPLTILEAMSSGLPIISTTVGAIPEIIENEKNGFLIEPHDINALKQAIKKLINNPSLARKIGCNNRNKILNKFDWKIIVNKLFVIYKSIKYS